MKQRTKTQDTSELASRLEREPRAEELLVQRYADGELRPTELRDLEERLLAEPELIRALERVVRARSYFRAAQPQPAPLDTGFADRVFHALQAEPEQEPEQEPESMRAELAAERAGPAPLAIEHTLRVWAIVAASLLLALTAFAFFAQGNGRDGTMMADDAPAQRARLLQELDGRARALEAGLAPPVEVERR